MVSAFVTHFKSSSSTTSREVYEDDNRKFRLERVKTNDYNNNISQFL